MHSYVCPFIVLWTNHKSWIAQKVHAHAVFWDMCVFDWCRETILAILLTHDHMADLRDSFTHLSTNCCVFREHVLDYWLVGVNLLLGGSNQYFLLQHSWTSSICFSLFSHQKVNNFSFQHRIQEFYFLVFNGKSLMVVIYIHEGWYETVKVYSTVY